MERGGLLPPAQGPAGASVPSPGALGDRLRELRNRLLGSARFRRWAAALPLTRGVARGHARELFDLCAGFVYSQVLLACVRLRILEKLAQGARSAAEVAADAGLTVERAERLLGAAVALRLVESRSGARYGLGPLGSVVVAQPGIAAMVEHHALLYADLADPVALLREEQGRGRLRAYWAYAATDTPAGVPGEAVAGYSSLMSASQALVAAEILDAYPVRRHRCVLDVGGGEGAFLAAVSSRAPHLRTILFDLPAVAERARVAAERDGRPLVAVGGDFLRDPLPEGADLVTLVRVLHDHDDAAVVALLKAVRGALAPGGTLLVAEPLAGAAGAETVGAAYFAFYLLAMGQGRARTAAELRRLLAAAGFADARERPTRIPLQTGLIVARPA